MRIFSKAGNVKHLSAKRGIRVTASTENVEHVFVVRKPREYSRLNLREITDDQFVTFGSHNCFA
jgi:hypothetical protein